MPTASELAAAVVVAKQALAEADLSTLQAFNESLNTGSWTVPALVSAIESVSPTLGDPDSASRMASISSNFQSVLDQFGQLVRSVQATAAPQG